MMYNVGDFGDDDDMMPYSGAATVVPSKTGYSSSSSSSSSSQVERVPSSQDSSGIFYDQFGQPMTVGEVKEYAARHNINFQ